MTTPPRNELPSRFVLKVGTLAAVLDDIGGHFEFSRDERLRRLFDR